MSDSSGSISGLISFIIYVSIISKPKAVVLFRLEMMESTSLGCTMDKLKEHCLPSIKVCSFNRGSEIGWDIFDLILCTFSIKNSF